MSSMSSFPQRKTQMAEPLPCPECGAVRMTRVAENCRGEEGLTVRRLRHFKCLACGARFFDDDAMHRIQSERSRLTLARLARATRPTKRDSASTAHDGRSAP